MEQILILLPVLALCYLLGWLFIPKGNFIHELWHLPPFWLQVISTSSKGLQEERVSYGKHARQYFLFYQPAGPPDKAKLPSCTSTAEVGALAGLSNSVLMHACSAGWDMRYCFHHIAARPGILTCISVMTWTACSRLLTHTSAKRGLPIAP